MYYEYYYIICCSYIDGTKSYVSNTNPIIWTPDKNICKKYYYKDDLYNDIRSDIGDLLRLKKLYNNIDSIDIIKYDNKSGKISERMGIV